MDENQVLLNFHTGEYGCIHVYAKCSKSVAEEFIKNVPVLNEYVMLLAVNGGACRDMLRDVIKIKIASKIKLHNYKLCPLYKTCDDSDEDYDDLNNCNGDMSLIIKSKKIIPFPTNPDIYVSNDSDYYRPNPTTTNVYVSCDSDLFESITMYSIMSIIHQILELNVKASYKNNIITKIQLTCNNELVMNFNVPDMYHCPDDFNPWIEPLKNTDINLINTINDLVLVLKYARAHKSDMKELIFSGYDNEVETSLVEGAEKKGSCKKKRFLQKKNLFFLIIFYDS